MNVSFHNFSEVKTLGGMSKSRKSDNRKQRNIRERIAEQEREMEIRESENTRIKKIHEEMDRARTLAYEKEISEESLRLTLTSLTMQIGQIYKDRENREKLAIEREMQRQQTEMEEKIREQEKRREERMKADDTPKTEEEIEKVIAHENMRGAALMTNRLDNINTLKSTRASLSSEAAHLEGAQKFSQMRQEIWSDQLKGRADIQYVRDIESNSLSMETIKAAEITASGNANLSYNLLDGFNGKHLTELKMKITRLDIKVNSEIGAMYRDSKTLQETQLRLNKEKSAAPGEEDEEQKEEYTPIDLKL